MACIVCHRSIGTRAKKCPVCGAPAALSKGEFLFEMNAADRSQLKKYYNKLEEPKNDGQEIPKTEVNEPENVHEDTARVGSTTPPKSTNRIVLGILLLVLVAILEAVFLLTIYLKKNGWWIFGAAVISGIFIGAADDVWNNNKFVRIGMVLMFIIEFLIVIFVI